jgi:hypothetical protein
MELNELCGISRGLPRKAFREKTLQIGGNLALTDKFLKIEAAVSKNKKYTVYRLIEETNEDYFGKPPHSTSILYVIWFDKNPRHNTFETIDIVSKKEKQEYIKSALDNFLDYAEKITPIAVDHNQKLSFFIDKNLRMYYTIISFKPIDEAINIRMSYPTRFTVFRNNEYRHLAVDEPKETSLIQLTESNTFFAYSRNGRGKFEMTLKSLTMYTKDYHEVFEKVILPICITSWRETNLLWRDIFDEKIVLRPLPPIKISDVFKYHNKHDYLCAKFKKMFVPKSVNKASIEAGFYTLKAAKMLSENMRAKLISTMLGEVFPFDKYTDETLRVSEIFKKYYRVMLMDDDFVFHSKPREINTFMKIIDDYVGFLFSYKITPPLTIKTRRGLIKRHDELAKRNRQEQAANLCVPKKSVFNKLKLPPEYERIKDGERLIREGEMNNNCVASYSEYINKDKCAIYSLVADGKRYTIEICRNQHNDFYISQMSGYSNSASPDEVYDRLEELIKEQNNLLRPVVAERKETAIHEYG